MVQFESRGIMLHNLCPAKKRTVPFVFNFFPIDRCPDTLVQVQGTGSKCNPEQICPVPDDEPLNQWLSTPMLVHGGAAVLSITYSQVFVYFPWAGDRVFRHVLRGSPAQSQCVR